MFFLFFNRKSDCAVATQLSKNKLSIGPGLQENWIRTKNENPSDWKNAVSISYISQEGQKSQFRIDADGKILVIHFPWSEYGKTKTIETLCSRITAVIPGWKPPRSIKKAAVLDMLIPITLVDGTIDIEKLKKSMFAVE